MLFFVKLITFNNAHIIASITNIVVFLYAINNNMSRITVASLPSVVELYVPRILGSVRKGTIINTFHELNIGKIIYIDMHRKINENKNAYFFAFIKLQLYHAFPAMELMSHLNEFNAMKITYNEETMQYWEVKAHIARIERDNHCCISESNVPPPATIKNECRSYNLWSGYPMLLPRHVYALNQKLLGNA